MSRVRIAVLASGHGSNLQALLDAFSDRDASAEVALVASNRADAGALERARRAGVATAVISRDGQDAEELIALLRAHSVDLVVLAGYLKRVPDAVVAACRDRILNVHPALLPMFGGPGMYGLRVHEAVLASGVRVSGATVHVVDEQYDHGAILAQWPVPVREGDTPETLAARVLEVEHRLLPAAVRAYGLHLARGSGRPPVLSLEADSFGPAATLPSSFDHALTIA